MPLTEALEELTPGDTGSELRLSPRPPTSPHGSYVVRTHARTWPEHTTA